MAGMARRVNLSEGPFENCWERIERAKVHNEALADAWNGLANNDVYEVFSYVGDDGAGFIRAIPLNSFPRAGFSLQLGELLYQLRSALDGLVYTAAILETGQNPPPDEKCLEFPICVRRRYFKDSIHKLGPLTQKRRDLIEAVQPYNAPCLAPELVSFNYNRGIGILNDWARKDRHRKLHVIGSWTAGASPQLRLPEGVTLASMTVKTGNLLENEDEIASFQLGGFQRGMKVEVNPDLFTEIAVDEAPAPCHPKDTFGARLDCMIRAVSYILTAVEESFNA